MTELEKKQAAQIQLLEEQIHVLKEQVDFMTKKLFGRSSETTPVGQGQLSIFEDNASFFKHQRQLRKKPSKKK